MHGDTTACNISWIPPAWSPRPMYQAPTFHHVWVGVTAPSLTHPRLSDADVERIAARVAELLKGDAKP